MFGLNPPRTCVIMYNMKRATIRQVQHHLSDVLKWVEDGEEVVIVRRDRVVGKIVPPDHSSGKRDWPDFAGRARRIWGRRIRGKQVSRIIIEDRKERL